MRPPEVFVRALSPEEGQRLKSRSRRARHYASRQRAAILLASASAVDQRARRLGAALVDLVALPSVP